MTLRSSLDDFKRHRGAATRFPGERRTTAGRFSGLDDRLVHVAPDGSLRDFSYPLVGLHGIDRSRFGLALDGEYVWFDEAESTQHYHGRTGLVETVHDLGDYRATQYDLTLGRTHLTRLELEDAPDGATPIAFYAFTPEGTDGRVGKLLHDDAAEVYHDREHDFVAAAPAVDRFATQVPEGFAELVDAPPVDLPRSSPERYEDSRLGGNVLVVAAAPETTFATSITDRTDSPRREALDDIASTAATYDSHDALREAAAEQAANAIPADVTEPVATDLRVVSMLTSDTGARIAGPDFDEHYAYSGGYGYTWFRDDAEIARFLAESATALDVDLSDRHAASAEFYERTQSTDGTWPHRVWPHNGALAPGWANSRIESGDGDQFQADQPGSIATFLATHLRTTPADDVENRDALVETIRSAIDGLDATLGEDGRPESCQNAWENMTGRFTHTAATHLHAYSAVARAPVPDDLATHAREQAAMVAAAIDDHWVPERGVYALRDTPDGLDDRLDSSTLALADAHREYAHVASIGDTRLARLDSHIETTIAGLYKDPDGPVEGLIRFEGDDWRTRDQDSEKIWTVSTAWAANAAATTHALFAAQDYESDTEYATRAAELLALVLPDGPLCMDTGYLPEQVFDDGTPDSATPLGWPHAIRLATIATLETIDDEQRATPAVSDD